MIHVPCNKCGAATYSRVTAGRRSREWICSNDDCDALVVAAELVVRDVPAGAPKVYLAGPISGCSYDGCTEWRDHAIQKLADSGIKGLSPMRAKEYLRSVESDAGFSATCEEYGSLSPLSGPRGIMTRDRFDATGCDVLLVNLLGATKVSVGTVMEIAWADLKRTPIVAVIEADGSNPHEHCMVDQALGFRCTSLDEALHVVGAILS